MLGLWIVLTEELESKSLESKSEYYTYWNIIILYCII